MSVGDQHFWPLYLLQKCSYFTFKWFFSPGYNILSWVFLVHWVLFLLMIIFYALDVWSFLLGCQTLWICWVLYIFVSLSVFLRFFWEAVKFLVWFDSSGICFSNFGGGSRAGLNLGLVVLCCWSRPTCILNLVPHELWGLLVWLMEGGWLQNLCKGWLLSPVIILGGSVPCWRQLSHVYMLINSRLNIWKGFSLVL